MVKKVGRSNAQVPPYSQDAERAVLGSILVNNGCFETVSGVLTVDDFYSEPHRCIFSAMDHLFGNGISIDEVTLGHALSERGDLKRIGGVMAIGDLASGVVTTVNIVHYIDIVREKSAVRNLIQTSQRVISESFDYSDVNSLYGLIDSVMEAGKGVFRTRMPDSMFDLGDSVLDLYKKVASGYHGFPLPWKTITKMTSGLWPKTFTLFVGRPGTGKSQIIIILGRHAVDLEIPTLVVSPEMSKEEMAERLFVTEAKVSYQKVIGGTLSDLEFPKFEGIIKGLKDKHGLYIIDKSDDLSKTGIESAIRACGAKLVLIDSIYKLKFKGDRKERAVGALEWSVEACDRMDFIACAFAQQNRDAEKSAKLGGGVRLGTIALADELAQDPHNIFALMQNKDEKKDGRMKIKPLKLRRGQYLGDPVEINWKWDSMDFSEIEADEEEEWSDEVPF